MTADATAVPATIRSPFAIPVFRAVWIANMVANFGTLIQLVGASWLMTSLTDSPTLIALVQASTMLPVMFFALWAGAVADNLDRRKVMLCAQGFMLIVSAILAVCAWQGVLTPWLLLGFTFLIGIGTAFNGPAWQASVGEMVPRNALAAAVAFNSMGFNLARSLGPAIGGIIVAAAGAATAFLVNSVSYIGLIVVLARWRPQLPSRLLPREQIGHAMEAGIRYIAMSPHLRIVMLRAFLFSVAASAIPALMPLIARDHISGGALTYGTLLGAFGLGAVAGALASRRLRASGSSEAVVRMATVAIAVGATVSAVSYILPITIIAMMVAGAGWVLALSTFNVTVQFASPRWVVGRALASYQMSSSAGIALGSWLFGGVAGAYGVDTALLVAGTLQAAGALIGLWRPLPEVEALNLDPLSLWTEPEIAVSIEPRSGPIVVTIEYRIAEENIQRFLAEMAERRRIRIRDGARHWALMRDLGEPDLWIERYHVATWLEYVRHNHRRTHADAANSERIAALHIGPDKPRVHRMIERQTGSLPATRALDPREMADPMTDPSRSS
jgi:MFS family permease